ncbi:MAG: nuclear transport factor 2 family protein [Ferruginibacter sp.]
MIKFAFISICTFFSYSLYAQQPDSADQYLLLNLESKMFDAFSKNDSAYINQLISEDYVSINADGKMVDKQVSLKNLSKFKGASFKLSDKKIRVYDNTAIINGRAKCYFRALLVADVWYTQVWHKQNGVWQYSGWQGTMTGWPSYYPVIVTLITILLLWLIFTFVFKNRRKKTY